MKITIALLYDLRACSSGIEDVTNWGLIGLEHDTFIRACAERNRFDYAAWLIVRLLKLSEHRTEFAIFAARQVLSIFEELCPGDDRPRRAIVAAEYWLMDRLHMTEENADVVVAAADFNATDIPVWTAALAAAVSAKTAARTVLASDVDSVPETDMAVAHAINAADYVGCIDAKRAIIEFGIELINEGE